MSDTNVTDIFVRIGKVLISPFYWIYLLFKEENPSGLDNKPKNVPQDKR